MARPKKSGLDYFTKSVNDISDFRMIELLDQYGPLGYMVRDVVMSYIYRNGYYLEADLKRLVLLVMRDVGKEWIESREQILEIIQFCGEIGYFDKELLERSVITSREIQELYAFVTTRRRSEGKRKYWLLDDDDSETGECEDESVEYEEETGECEEETGEYEEETGENEEETGEYEDESGLGRENAGLGAREDVSAEETRNHSDNGGVIAAIMPQSKANKSKANKTKLYDSKAAESKAKQDRAEEIFRPEEAAADDKADGIAGHDDQGDLDADSAGYRRYTYSHCIDQKRYPGAEGSGWNNDPIEELYCFMTGKRFTSHDWRVLDGLRDMGIDDSDIREAMLRVDSRGKEDIHTFSYFVPMIQEQLI